MNAFPLNILEEALEDAVDASWVDCGFWVVVGCAAELSIWGSGLEEARCSGELLFGMLLGGADNPCEGCAPAGGEGEVEVWGRGLVDL